MTPQAFADIAASEIIERASNIIAMVQERCELEDCPLTVEQRKYLGTGVLAAFMGVTEVLERMCRTAEVLSRFTDMDTDVFPAEWLDTEPMQ